MHARQTAAFCLIACMLASLARADESTFALDIPSQSLKGALSALAEQTGLQIVYQTDLAVGLSSPAVKGKLTPSEALEYLLRGTGLDSRFLNERAIAISTATTHESPMTTGITPTAGLLRLAQASVSVQSDQVDTVPMRQSTPGGSVELKEIVVTGTRIRGAPPASPLIVVTQEEMQNAGHADLGEVARNILQNFNGGQNPGVAGGGNQAGQNNLNNSSALNLRGFGPDATLTLINGHRTAYDAINQGVDISAIPVAAVERIEVMADGASALYGSDAVGGVANIILKRDFEGIDTSVQFGASTDGGNEKQQYSIVTGRRWASGGFMTALDYGKSTEIAARDRSYTGGLHGSQYLTPGQEQFGVVIAGHQSLSGKVDLEFDANFNKRGTETANAFSTTSGVFTNGLFSRPGVQSYSLTPTLKLQLPSQWQGSLSGTYSESKTSIPSRQFSQGVESRRGMVSYVNTADSIELGAEGKLFSAPGGSVRLAVGGGYRSAELDSNVTATTTSSGVTRTTADFTGSRDVYFGYGELSIPLVGNNNAVALVERLSLSAALRHEAYRSFSDVTTPKFGVIYQPHRDVTMRMSWGKSFKVATLNQEYTVPSGYLLPTIYYVPPPPGGGTVMTLGGGSVEPLEPERATTWTATIGYQPEFVVGLGLEASYFDVRYRDRVATPVSGVTTSLGNPSFAEFFTFNPSVQEVLDAIAGLPLGLSNQTGQPFDPSNVGVIIRNSLQNISSEYARGVDFSADYNMELSAADRLRLSASFSYLDTERRVSARQPKIERSGIIFTPPHWRGKVSGTWQRSSLTMTGTVSYIGGTRDNRTLPHRNVGSFTTLDLVGRYRPEASEGLLRDFEAGVSVMNVLNEEPDKIYNTNPLDPPYDSLNYSVVGRFIALSFSKKIL